MAFWNVDLETRMGARSAMDQVKLACFIFAGISAFGGIMAFWFNPGPISILNFLPATIALIAGLRLKAGEVDSVFWAIAAAALLVLIILSNIFGVVTGTTGFLALSFLVAFAILLIMMINGIRAAFALRKGEFAEDHWDTFE